MNTIKFNIKIHLLMLKIVVLCMEYFNKLRICISLDRDVYYATKKNFRLPEKVWIDRYNKTHSDRYEYSLVEYKNKRTKICKKHGVFMQLADAHIYVAGCPSYRKTLSEKKIFREVAKIFNHTEFIVECNARIIPYQLTYRNLELDSYIPDLSLVIEYNGEHHCCLIDFFGGEKSFVKRIELDEFKKNWCKENNILIITIPYTKFGYQKTEIENDYFLTILPEDIKNLMEIRKCH